MTAPVGVLGDASLFLQLDLPAMLAGTLACVCCAVLGNFLVLRRMSLMGDAISHAVLPGLVAAFLLAGTRDTWPMFLGAAASGLLTVGLVELVRRAGRLEPGAAMGVVFSLLFALGLVLIRHAEGVDLDADCVLSGQLEHVFFARPVSWETLLTLETLAALPRQVTTLAAATAGVSIVVAVFFKELRLAAFDPAHASALGFPSGVVHALLMTLVAGAVVASFEAVGSILVIAMLVVPPATARLLTERLSVQIGLSVLLAGASGVLGYLLGAFGPNALGAGYSIGAAGCITSVAGLGLGLALLLAPAHGVLPRRVRRWRLAADVAREDVLALLYRAEEDGAGGIGLPALRRAMRDAGAPGAAMGLVRRAALRAGRRRGEFTLDPRPGAPVLRLTDAGRDAARRLVRSHRLWEAYLVREVGLRPDHVHRTAMALEHVTGPDLGRGLAPDPQAPTTDPHDRPIPHA